MQLATDRSEMTLFTSPLSLKVSTQASKLVLVQMMGSGGYQMARQCLLYAKVRLGSEAMP